MSKVQVIRSWQEKIPRERRWKEMTNREEPSRVEGTRHLSLAQVMSWPGKDGSSEAVWVLVVDSVAVAARSGCH